MRAPPHAAPPPDAKCGHHPDVSAVATCSRCGLWVCGPCTRRYGGETPFCEACFALRSPKRGGAAEEVARAQRGLMLSLVLSLAALPAGLVASVWFPALPREVLLVALPLIYVSRAIATFMLASALQRSPLLWALGSLVPNIVGIIVLLVINHLATTRLRELGWTVGLFGGRPSHGL